MTTAESKISANGSIINTVKKFSIYNKGNRQIIEAYKQGSRNYIRNGNFRGAIKKLNNCSTLVLVGYWMDTFGKNNGD